MADHPVDAGGHHLLSALGLDAHEGRQIGVVSERAEEKKRGADQEEAARRLEPRR
jgi:hypothetical protein